MHPATQFTTGDTFYVSKLTIQLFRINVNDIKVMHK